MTLEKLHLMTNFKAPSTWTLMQSDDQEGRAGAPIAVTYDTNQDFRVSFFYRGVPVDTVSAESVRRLIVDRDVTRLSSRLSEGEIIELTAVLGATSLGDNQWSNPAPSSDPAAPNFRLAQAEVRRINGVNVLWVSGAFRSGTACTCVLVPHPQDPRIIEELFSETEADSETTTQEQASCLQSILTNLKLY
jgi:hypothetical protein